MASEDLDTVPVMTGFTKAPPTHDDEEPDQNRAEGAEDPEHAVADREQGEGQHQTVAESHPVGQCSGEEREEIDQGAEEAGDDPGLDVIEPDDADEICPERDKRAVVGRPLAELGGVAGPKGAGKAPGGLAFVHEISLSSETELKL